MNAEAHLAAALEALGFTGDPELGATPVRVAEMLRGFAPGRPLPELELFEAPATDPVILRGLPFHSLCAHHLLPFFGAATVAYRPAGQVSGLGGVARALRFFARQPQLQERMGAQLADFLHERLRGPVVVRLRARQMCMEMRGAESPGEVETLALRGPGAEALVGLLG